MRARSAHLLTSINIDVLDGDGIMLNSISLDESDVVPINREGEEGAAGNGKDAQPVSLPLDDIDNSIGN